MALAVVGFLVASSPAPAITWGEPDAGHENVGAMVVDYPGYGPYQWCSGTLIHPRLVLTAGHCTVDLAYYGIETVWVNFDPDANNHAALRSVDQVITHPDYDWGPTSNPYDVGALVLAEPAVDIAPADLPSEGLLGDLRAARELREGAMGAKFTLVGYGGSLDWPPPVITYENQRQSSVSEYQALLKSWLRMSQNRATGDGGTCYGDSGGPAFWTHPDGTEILVGVTSWGDVPCVAAAFNYRVDTADTLDFIDEVVTSLDP
jgi:secreted trypsin-like serine protease